MSSSQNGVARSGRSSQKAGRKPLIVTKDFRKATSNGIPPLPGDEPFGFAMAGKHDGREHIHAAQVFVMLT